MQLGHRIAYDVTFATIALISASLRLWIRYGVTSRKYTTHTIAAGTATTTTITAGRGRSTKRRRLKSYYIGDAFLVLGLFLTLAFAVRNVQLEATVLKQRSPPKDVWLLQPWLLKIQEAGKIAFEQYVIATMGVCALKACLCLYYVDMADVLSRRMLITIYAVLALSISILMSLVMWLFLRCQPLSKYWSISTDNCLIHNVKLQAIVGLTCHLSTDLALLILGLYLLSISHSIHSTATRPLIAGIAFVVLLGCTTIVVNILRGTMVLRYSGALDTRSHIVLGSEDAWKGADWLTLTSMAGLGIGCMVVALPTMRTGWREWRVRRGHSARKDDGEQQDRFGWSSPAYDHQMQKHHNQIQLRQLQQQQQQQQHQDQRQQEEQRKLWPWPLIGAWSKTRSSTSVALNTAIPQIGVLADVKECGCGKAEWEACEWGAADEEDDDQAESDGSHISPTTTTDGRAWARRESDDDNIEEEERRIHSGVITGSGHERTHSRKGSDRDRWSYNERWSKRWSWKDLDTADVR